MAMRNIRIAPPQDRLPVPPPGPGGRRRRAVDWLATLPLIVLLPALLFVGVSASASGPSLSVSPATTTAGTRITITAQGFPKGDRGYLAWDGATGGTSYRARGNGTFRLSLTVPATALPAVHTVTAFSGTGNATRRASVSVTVVSKLTATPPPSGSTAGTPTPTASLLTIGSPAPSGSPLVGPSATPAAGATATPGPTSTTAPVITPAPTPAPTPVPTTATSASCGSSLQDLVNATATGGTLQLGSCTYHEAVTISRSMTLVGPATVTGDGTRSTGISITASGVTLDGLTVTRVANAVQTGAIDASGVDRITLRNVKATNSTGACINIEDSTGSSVLNSLMSGCTQEGYHFSKVSSLVFSGNRVTGNNTALTYSPGWEAGGGKFATDCTNVVVSNNEVDHNGGPGIWFDNHNNGITISGNRVHDNYSAGIFYEISSGAVITGNVTWHNATTSSGEYAWGWGAGILVSSSNHVEVANNVVAWNGDGISVISQNRSDAPAATTGIYVHDNDIFGTDGWPDSSQDYGLAWLQDWSGVLFASSSGNHASGNAFWYSTAEGPARYAWGGRDYSSLSAFAGTPGGAGSTYLSSTQKSSILSNAGVPQSP